MEHTSTMADSIFTKIINKEIPATIHYEDDAFIAINDINPKAPVHILIIPKKPYQTLEKVDLNDSEFHYQLLATARKVAKQMGIQDNYKLFMNVGERVQQVQHIHLHLTGGWPAEKDITEIEAEARSLILE
jgi:histidine triad (HIT) family protein